MHCRAAEGFDRGAQLQPQFRTQLCLWCMSPAVAFQELQSSAHSVVLTSGTLSPLDSMAYEARPASLLMLCAGERNSPCAGLPMIGIWRGLGASRNVPALCIQPCVTPCPCFAFYTAICGRLCGITGTA